MRSGSRPAQPRTQSSIAVSGDYRRWFLVNASPDVRAQLAGCAVFDPRGVRDSPIEEVLLTDAELDHTVGLLLLRESGAVRVHATAAVQQSLCAGSGVVATLRAFCAVEWRPVRPRVEVELADGVSYRAFEVPTRKPDRFGVAGGAGQGRVVGYRFTDTDSGAAVVYLPGVQEMTPQISEELAGCAVALVDGTCWSDDELAQAGVGAKTAFEMGHLAMSGPGGSLARLAQLGIGRVIYVHINNTNPVLLEDSPQRRTVTDHGFEIATDGLEVAAEGRKVRA